MSFLRKTSSFLCDLDVAAVTEAGGGLLAHCIP